MIANDPQLLERLQANIRARLRAADQAFRETGDVLAALGAVQFAIKHSQPVPASIAAWLANGIGKFLSGEARSLDGELGIVARTRADPRRSAADRARREGLMAEMAVLRAIGAKVEDARLLVAARSGLAQDTLRKHWQAYPLKAEASWTPDPRVDTRFVAEILAGYPDDKEGVVKQAKQRIFSAFNRKSGNARGRKRGLKVTLT